MKIAVIGDVHWSQYSSIVRRRGENYSYRLENLISSVNWAENLAVEAGCDLTIYLGDFFDKESLCSEELSALTEVKWNNLHHVFIVGNHEMGRSDLSYSSAHLFGLSDFDVIHEPTSIKCDNNLELCYLPYILETNRKDSITDYFGPNSSRRVIFSHNDIKDFQMGQFLSKTGFGIDDIDANCDLYLNGHLHNGGRVSKNIINVGNLTGQNFSEDAYRYDHTIFILDTDTLKCDVYENPYALNFYKIDAIEHVPNIKALKNNAVVTLKCLDTEAENYKAALQENENIIESRLIIERNLNVDADVVIENLAVDHLQQFQDYILNTLGNSQIVVDELAEVLK